MILACTAACHADGEEDEVEEELEDRNDNLGVPVHCAVRLIHVHHLHPIQWEEISCSLALLPRPASTWWSAHCLPLHPSLLSPLLHAVVHPDVDHDDQDNVDNVPGVVHVNVLEVGSRG